MFFSCTMSMSAAIIPGFAQIPSAAEKYFTCGDLLVNEGLVDRELGRRNKRMVDFINRLPDFSVEEYAEAVDVENFLKNLAAYAVSLAMDSPLGNGNNFLIADAGDGRFKIVQYDHNNMGTFACGDDAGAMQVSSCCTGKETLRNFAVSRPMCGPPEKNLLFGRLLQNAGFYEQYLGYVREFHALYAAPSLFAEMDTVIAALRPLIPQDPIMQRMTFDDEDLIQAMIAHEFDEDKQEEEAPMDMILGDMESHTGFMRARGRRVAEQLAVLEVGEAPAYVKHNIVCYTGAEVAPGTTIRGDYEALMAKRDDDVAKKAPRCPKPDSAAPTRWLLAVLLLLA